MRRHLLLLTFTLILSHFSISNLWADAAQDTWIGSGKANAPTFAEQFKWYSLPAVTLPSSVVDIQNPWATGWGIYVTFPESDFNQVYYNGTQKTDGTDYYKQGAGVLFHISSLTEQNTVILIKKDNNTKYGLRIYNSAVTINAAGTKLLYSYADGQYTSASGSETSCAGTISSTNNIITGSDFYWSGRHSATVQRYDNTWTGVASSITCCSRDEITFSASTYKISIVTKNTEGGTTRKLPKVQINGTNYSVQRVIVGGVSQSFSDNQWTYAGNTETTLEYDIDYSRSGSGTYHVSMVTDENGSGGDKDKYLFKSLTISSAAPSCTAPNHVDISGNWDYFGGETISLTATAYSSAGTESPIADANITGYQWKHNGSNISGATSKTLTITNCTADDGGDYTCVVSTGATCNTESSAMGTKVYALQCYTDGTTTYNFTRDGSNKIGTAEVTLTSGQKQFKIYAGGSQYYGNNTSAIYSDISNYVFKDNEGNFKLEAGLGGTFTFTIDYTDNGGAPKVSVLYPRKTIYLDPGVWNTGSAKFAYYYFISETVKGWTDFLTSDDCGMYADIPQWNGVKINAVRLNNTCTSPNWDDKWNQTSNITINSNNSVVVTDWGSGDSPSSYGTYAVPTYTISYAKGSPSASISGSKADETKTCGVDFTLPSDVVFTRTGYEQTGWATEDGGSKVYELGYDYTTNSAQEFFPFWTAKTTTISFDQNSGSGGQTSSLTATYGSAMPTPITTPTRTGYEFDGYYDGVGGAGDKYYNADGSSARNWDKENATWTLSAKWTAKDYTVTYSNPGNSNSYTISVDGGSAGSENKTAHYGNTITLVASAYTGYAFSSWTIKKTSDNSDVTASVGLSGQTSTASFTMPDYGVTVVATFNVAVTYAVTVDKNADYGTVTGASNYAAGATVNISATPYGGYEFDNWTTNDGVTFANANSASTSFMMIGSAVTVQANFKAETCEREWVLQAEDDYITLTTYHDAMPAGITVIPDNESAYSEYTGYDGRGYVDWKNTGGALYFHIDLPTGTYNFTYRNNNCDGNRYANIYKAGADPLDGHSVEYDSKIYGKVQFKELGKCYDGKSFSDYGWNNVSLSAGDYIISYYAPAQWTALDKITITKTNTYTVSYNATGAATGSTISAAASGSGLASGSPISACTEVTFTADPADGYEVEHWQVGGVTYAAFDGMEEFTLAINRNVTVTYTTVAKTYTVTLDDGGAETSVSPTSVTATYNSSSLSSAITNPDQSGYTFDGWYTGEGGKSGSKVIDTDGSLQTSVAGYTDGSGNWTHDDDVTLYAKYTVDGGGGGEPSGDCEGTGCKEALLGGNAFTNGYDYTITSDNSGNVNISVTFLDHQTGMGGELYMLNSSGGELGGFTSMTWNNSTYTATHTLTGQSGTIYFKVRVPYSGGVYVTKMFTVNVGVDCTEGGGGSTYTVTYNANGADDGTEPVDAFSPYLEDATVTVLGNKHDLTKDGYTFKGWNTADDGRGTHYDEGDTFTITEDVTLYAEWKDTSDPTLCSNNGGPESGQTSLGDDKLTKFKDGYTFSVKEGSTANHLTVSASLLDDDVVEVSMGKIYLLFHSSASTLEEYDKVVLSNSSAVSVSNVDVDLNSLNVANDPILCMSIKFELGGTGIEGEVRITDRMYFDRENGGCTEPEEGEDQVYFDIYHYDDAASAPEGARTSYEGGNIVVPIRYFRHFDDNWSTITLPFDVDSVGVYEDDKKLYLLYPRFTNNSGSVEGYYWLKTFNNWSSTTVSVANFQSSWQQPNYATNDNGSNATQERNLALNVLPQKNVPYVISFPDNEYYNNNWVIFYGAPFQTIPSSADGNCVGILAGETGQLKLQRNNMMKPTNEMTDIYMLEEGYDYFARQTSAVPAFESYVLGSSDVIEQYVQIRYRGGGNLPTEVESLPTTSGYDGVIYTVSGVRVATFADRVTMEAKLSTLPSGVYVVRCGSTVDKVVVR